MTEDRFGTRGETDLLRAFQYVVARRRTIAITCAVAVACTLGVSLLLPRKYTAVCRILIEPPGGTDVRVATAVSPVYLESLRTYELFASSDDLFLRAAGKFGIRAGAGPIDRLKKSVLKVEIPRSTKILELYATLPDPVKAHALALYLGEQTVTLSRSVGVAGEQQVISAAERETTQKQERYRSAEQAWAEALARGPAQALSDDIDADLDLRSRLKRQLVAAEAYGSDTAAAVIRREATELDRQIAAKQKLVGERSAILDRLDGERQSAEADFKAARQRLEELRAAAGHGSERLSIIDPGVVPERPSSPNIPLNVTIAALAALALSVLWLLVAFGLCAGRAEAVRAPAHRGAA